MEKEQEVDAVTLFEHTKRWGLTCVLTHLIYCEYAAVCGSGLRHRVQNAHQIQRVTSASGKEGSSCYVLQEKDLMLTCEEDDCEIESPRRRLGRLGRREQS